MTHHQLINIQDASLDIILKRSPEFRDYLRLEITYKMLQIAFERLDIIEHQVLGQIEAMQKSRLEILRIYISHPKLTTSIQ